MTSDPIKIKKRIMVYETGKPIPSLNLFLSKVLDNPLSGVADIYLQKKRPDPKTCKPLAIYLYYDGNTLKFMAVREDKSAITGKVPTHQKGGILKKAMVLTKEDLQAIKERAPLDGPKKLSDLAKGSAFRLMSHKPTLEERAKDASDTVYLCKEGDGPITYYNHEGTELKATGLSPEDTQNITDFFKTRKVLVDKEKEIIHLSERVGVDRDRQVKALNSLFEIISPQHTYQPERAAALKTLTLAVSTLDYTPSLLSRFSNLFITRKNKQADKPKPEKTTAPAPSAEASTSHSPTNSK
jgi:hypothetical protein